MTHRAARGEAEATVPADDRGLLLGDGLFETVRLYRGRPFRLDAHLNRLAAGAVVVGIPLPEDLSSRVNEALASWGSTDGSLRITLTRGSGRGLTPPPNAKSRLLVAVRPLTESRGVHEGVGAVLRGRVDERSLVSGLKAIGYLERIQALRLAHDAGADEAFLRNSKDLVVEGSASNLLAAMEGTLVAPGPAQGALAGITREVVLDEVARMGLPVDERGLTVEELGRASEIFLTSSIREIAPVVRVEGRPIGSGVAGPLFRQLSERFRARVEAELL